MLQGTRQKWAHAIVVGRHTQPIAQRDSGTSRRSARPGGGKAESRQGTPERMDDERLAADPREGLSCGHSRHAGLSTLPRRLGPQSRTPRERAPSPGKRVEPRLAGMITAAREEENRATDSGAAAAAEDTTRGLRPATPLTAAARPTMLIVLSAT